MIHLPNLTSAGLLDHVEALLRRTVPGGAEVATRAYLADDAGRVAVLEIATPSSTTEHQAVGAIIGLEMRSRACAFAILQVATLRDRHREGPRGEVVGLHHIDRAGGQVGCRLLLVQRERSGRIVALQRCRSADRRGIGRQYLDDGSGQSQIDASLLRRARA